jgi:hypothetical protein
LKISLVSLEFINGYDSFTNAMYPLNAAVSTGEDSENEIVGKVTAFDRFTTLSSPNKFMTTGSVLICNDLNAKVFIRMNSRSKMISHKRN